LIHFLAEGDAVAEALNLIRQWLEFDWPMIRKERKQYFTVAFGCTGGRHRSVYMAEQMADWLKQQGMALPIIQHRDLGIVERRHSEKKGDVS